MDATATLDRPTPLAQLARAAIVTATVGYFALSASLFFRRTSGELLPLAVPLLIVLAVSVPVAILLSHLLWQTVRAPHTSTVDWWMRLAPTASAFLLAAAVSLPGTSPPALAALWLAIVAVEASFLSRELAQRGRSSVAVARTQQVDASTSISPRTTQSLVRETTAEGETITGELLGRFRSGERTIYLHVAFCPPLASAPAIECVQLDGPDVEIKVSQAQTFGARFDVRLNRVTGEACDVLIAFAAMGEIVDTSAEELH